LKANGLWTRAFYTKLNSRNFQTFNSKISRIFQDQNHFPISSENEEKFLGLSRTFQEAWEPGNAKVIMDTEPIKTSNPVAR